MKDRDRVPPRERLRHRAPSPHFDAGIIPEPRILFGSNSAHVDPKTGLTLYGPFSPSTGREPVLSTIVVGIVGPPEMVADAQQWLSACKNPLTNDGKEPFLRPHFPGIRRESPFHCDLVFGETWSEAIRNRELVAATAESDWNRRLRNVIDLYRDAVEVLSSREPKPHVVLCCFPDSILDRCTFKRRNAPRTPPTKARKSRAQRDASAGQGFLLPDLTATLGTEDEEAGHHNLRRGLKAEAMRFGIPTQLVWPGTLQVTQKRGVKHRRAVQDIATRAWNFAVALYHKAGGSPWRLENVQQDTCFVGVSFYRELLGDNPRLRTSMAQAFTAAGNGYVLRGDSFEWDDSKQNKSPHLDSKSAAKLMRDVLDLYKRQNRGHLPGRVVVHKTSLFSDAELDGFGDACRIVPEHDFVAFGRRDIQFYRAGDYPPLRGTYVKFSEEEFALYTDGYIPFLRTYPGVRVPRPLEIIQHVGDSPWNTVLKEILGLTKMNWNTADFSCSMPISIAFSRRVGEILAELPESVLPQREYRFYM